GLLSTLYGLVRTIHPGVYINKSSIKQPGWRCVSTGPMQSLFENHMGRLRQPYRRGEGIRSHRSVGSWKSLTNRNRQRTGIPAGIFVRILFVSLICANLEREDLYAP